MKRTNFFKQKALMLCLFVFYTMSYADTPALITFQSTITPPIWTPDLDHGGLGGEILELLSKKAGVPYQIKYLPVKRFQQSLAVYLVGDPDILEVQKPYIVLPILVFQSAFFFYRPNQQPVIMQKLSDLKGYTLGVLRGTIEDKNYFLSQDIKIQESDSIESLLKKLKKGRIDTCILVRIAGLHEIRHLFPQEQKNFTFVAIPKSARPVALIIDPATAEAKSVAARYQKVLHNTLHSYEYGEILNRYYGKEFLAADWFKLMDKYERIYSLGSN